MKKIPKLIAAFVLAFALIGNTNVFAATHSITINNSATGHTYEAYQIFTGDLSSGLNTLSNIDWGDDVLSTYTSGKDATTIASYIEAHLAEDGTTARTPAEWATVLGGVIDGTPTGSVNAPSNGGYTISGLDDGYYLIKDMNNTLSGKYDAYTEFILKLVGNAIVDPKSDVPTADKKIDETTDVDNSANYRVGDYVNYVLKGTMPSNYANYTSYKVTFHDKLSGGLTLDAASIKVYNGSTEIASNSGCYTVNTTNPSDNGTFDVVFANTKSNTCPDFDQNSEIYVKYRAQVNSNAVVGGTGNGNELKIEFSNNPSNPNETGTTTTKVANVHLYDIILNKIDEHGNALSGATFQLERQTGANTWEVVDTIAGTGTDANEFTFTRLGLGTYRLTETVTPDGFNTIDQVTIVVTGDVDETGFTALSATGLTFTANLPNGTLTADVINVSGAQLPFTGGIGTTIFTILGIAFVSGAIVVFARKKSNKESE